MKANWKQDLRALTLARTKKAVLLILASIYQNLKATEVLV
jgi:hypothetical protein